MSTIISYDWIDWSSESKAKPIEREVDIIATIINKLEEEFVEYLKK